ncbi:hypothetical protein [Serinibacter salmoneus]|uniref:Uncharacterized protein n=1 Tax=Serinibacter salmoneus TaxID=556530 RepID=A0A2A9D0E6_9MICO|nr:hypothetical protein [Serinibacter salmoneus]PFG19861.1 hypothetical protein ATL40_1437 [Serinibacter salmoneus]
MAKRSTAGVEPPELLDKDAAAVWREVVAAHPQPARIVGPDLEVFCGQVALARNCRDRVAQEGEIVEGAKREPIPHPAIALGKAAQEYVAKHAPRFSPPAPMKRRTGPVYDATRRSLAAAAHLKDRAEFEGAAAALLTLAWLIDEAQRAGYAALEKAAFGTIPSYLKGCAELQITPASLPVPVAPAGATKTASNVTSMQDRARARRGSA